MVSPFPWSYLILLWSNFNPFHGGPVQNTDRIETLLIGPSASEDDDLVIFLIVVHRTVGSLCWNIAFSFDLSPFHCYRVECPYVAHVVRVSVTSEEYDLLADDTATVTPTSWGFVWRWWKCFDLSPSVFIHAVFKKNMLISLWNSIIMTVKFI